MDSLPIFSNFSIMKTCGSGDDQDMLEDPNVEMPEDAFNWTVIAVPDEPRYWSCK